MPQNARVRPSVRKSMPTLLAARNMACRKFATRLPALLVDVRFFSLVVHWGGVGGGFSQVPLEEMSGQYAVAQAGLKNITSESVSKLFKMLDCEGDGKLSKHLGSGGF